MSSNSTWPKHSSNSRHINVVTKSILNYRWWCRQWYSLLQWPNVGAKKISRETMHWVRPPPLFICKRPCKLLANLDFHVLVCYLAVFSLGHEASKWETARLKRILNQRLRLSKVSSWQERTARAPATQARSGVCSSSASLCERRSPTSSLAYCCRISRSKVGIRLFAMAASADAQSIYKGRRRRQWWWFKLPSPFLSSASVTTEGFEEIATARHGDLLFSMK